jgi:hypothetical protein
MVAMWLMDECEMVTLGESSACVLGACGEGRIDWAGCSEASRVMSCAGVYPGYPAACNGLTVEVAYLWRVIGRDERSPRAEACSG